MTNNKKTLTWLKLSEEDLEMARSLLQEKSRAHYAAYFCHQTIEKMLKAIISRQDSKIPAPTHNFKILLDQTGLKNLPEDRKKFLFSLMPHYIGTRYPEDITNLYKSYTVKFVTELFQKTEEMFLWLKEFLK